MGTPDARFFSASYDSPDAARPACACCDRVCDAVDSAGLCEPCALVDVGPAYAADDAAYAAVIAAVSGGDVSVDDAEAAIAAGALDGGR